MILTFLEGQWSYFVVPLDLEDRGCETPARAVVHNAACEGPVSDRAALITHEHLGFAEQCLHSTMAFSSCYSVVFLLLMSFSHRKRAGDEHESGVGHSWDS